MHKRRSIREVLADNLRARMKADPAIGNQLLLAKRSGIDQGHLSRVLKLSASPTIDFLEKLARGCRCTAAELLADGDELREELIRRALER